MKDIYLNEGLQYIPKILNAARLNRASANFGCLDREFWHYKTIDFPCGMSQEAVLALALAYRHYLDPRF